MEQFHESAAFADKHEHLATGRVKTCLTDLAAHTVHPYAHIRRST